MDANGFSPEKLKVWVTGRAYIRMDGDKKLLTPEQWGASPVTVPPEMVNVGIWMKDGGPEDGREVGEVTEYFQPEFQVSGDPKRTFKVKAAEDNDAVQWLDHGKIVKDGQVVVDGVNDEVFPLLQIMKRRDGAVRYRHGLARVSEFSPETADRGTNEPTSITFQWVRDESIGGFYREKWVQPAGAAPEPEPGV